MSFELQDAQELQYIWDNRGQTPDGDQVELNDIIATTNAPMFLPQVVNTVIREAAEPLLVGTSLLNRIEYRHGPVIELPGMMGALVAADIGEAEEYPERHPQVTTGTQVAKIGKSGLAVSITEEMIKWSQFDIINMMLRQAGFALGRHKEMKIWNMIKAFGVTAFDNLTPSQSLYGVTHGRDAQGQPNGSLVVDDIFDAWGTVLNQGYTPNTMVMHPLTWVMFVKDPVLRAFAQANGGGVFFSSWTGNAAGRAPWRSFQAGEGVSPGQSIVPGTTPSGQSVPHSTAASGILEYPQNMSTAPKLPSYANLPLAIIVTPFVKFDPRSKLTDIYLLDRNELGVLAVEEDINTGQWEDPARDLRKVKVREKYALAILAEGKQTSKIANVKVVPNEIVLPAQATISTSSSITEIDPSTPVV